MVKGAGLKILSLSEFVSSNLIPCTMKPKKYTHKDARKIDLKSKIIYKYPTPNKELEVNYMKVDGRHPIQENKFIIEHKCQFVVYVTKGKGKIFAGNEIFDVKIGDVVFVPINNRFAVEGKLEYVTFENPAWYPEQSEIIEVKK